MVLSIPLMDYEAARRLQWRLHDERLADVRPDTLVLLEHEPVLTLGRTTKDAHWNWSVAASGDRGLRVIASERGGARAYPRPPAWGEFKVAGGGPEPITDPGRSWGIRS